MELKELKQRSDKELAELVRSLREKLRAFRFEVAADSLKDVREIRDAKKTIARALTLAHERAKSPAPAKTAEPSLTEVKSAPSADKPAAKAEDKAAAPKEK